MEDDGARHRYDYTSPAFDFSALLVYDESGLVLDYPASPSAPADARRNPAQEGRRAVSPAIPAGP
jgi:hypothetical protein